MSHAEEFFGNGAKDGGENGERETEKLHAKIGQLTMEKDFLSKALGRDPMSERRQMVQREHSLPVTIERCELLEVARSTAYYRPSPVSEADYGADASDRSRFMLERPFYGSRRMRDELETRGHWVNRKRVTATDAPDGAGGALSDCLAQAWRVVAIRSTRTCSGTFRSRGRTRSGQRTSA